MTAIFTGLGSGLARSSASVLGGSGQLGSAALGRGGEGVSVNAANGNLIISRQDEFLVGRGPDAVIGRTYNSLGEVSDRDNGDQWQMGTSRWVYDLSGTLNAAGSTVKRQGADGSVVTYTYGTRGGVAAYWAADGSGAHEKLVKSGSTWIWTDGSSQITETYEASVGDATAFRIKEQTDTDGYKLSFAYVSGTDKLDRVTTHNHGTANATTGAPEQSYVQYTWSGNNITQIVTGYTDYGLDQAGEGDNVNKTLTRTRYAYDGSNRLTTVTVDLSPEDNNISDGQTYVTTYTYDGTSTRVASITQTDGSSLAIGYDSSGRVVLLTQAVTTGEVRTTKIGYGVNVTSITDASDQVTRLWYDNKGQLIQLMSPPATKGGISSVLQFEYDADGNILRKIETDSINASVPNNLVQAASWGDGESADRGENLVDDSGWPQDIDGTLPTNGTIGPGWTGGYVGETEWQVTGGPYGTTVTSLLAGQNDATDGAGGGLKSNPFDIDVTKTYEFTYYFKLNAPAKHSLYFGLGELVDIAHNGQNTTNPYFVAATAASQNSLYTVGKWYKVVGYVLPLNSENITRYSLGGVYDTETGAKIGSTDAFRWSNQRTSDTAATRFFNFYGTDIAKSTNFYKPEVREVADIAMLKTGDVLDVAQDRARIEVPSAAGWTPSAGISSDNEARWSEMVGPDGAWQVGLETGQFDGAADGGGYHTNGFTVDPTKTYRFTQYVRKSDLTRHNIYLGLTGGTVAYVKNASSGAADTNPYFLQWPASTQQLHLQEDRWYKVVSYVLPQGSANIPSGSLGGIYDAVTGERITNVTNFRWNESMPGNQVYARFFTYYDQTLLGWSTDWLAPEVVQIDNADLAADNLNPFGITYDEGGKITSFTYDGMGNVLSSTDANGNVVTRTYGAKNELLTETRTGSDATGAAVSHTTRYAYDAENHLRYQVSAEGTVTEYRYFTTGQLSYAIEYPEHSYTSAGTLTEGVMDTWRDGITDRSSTKVTIYAYDGRDNLYNFVDYGYATTAGAASSSEGYSRTYYAYDQTGRMLIRYDLGQAQETFVYDGLGRLKASVDLAGGATTYRFDDANSTTIVHLASGLTRTQVYNKAGDLISETSATPGYQPEALESDISNWVYDRVTRTTATAIGGAAAYTYTVSATGTYGYVRKTLAVAAGETVTWRITVKGNPSDTHQLGLYGNLENWGAIAGTDASATIVKGPGWIRNAGANGALFTLSGLSQTNETVIEVRRTFTQAQDFSAYFYLGGTSLSVPAGTTVTLAATNITRTVTDANEALNSTASYLYDKDGRLRVATDPTGNKTYYLYDKAGRKIADVNHFGHIVEYRYDSEGRVVARVNYTKGLTAAQIAELGNPSSQTEIASIRPTSDAADIWSWSVYDGAGRLIESIDGSGGATVYSYDNSNKLIKTVSYYNKIAAATITGFKTTAPTLLVLPTANSVEDAVSRSFYNADGQLIGRLDGEGYLTEFKYDKAGQKVEEVAYATVTSSGLWVSGTLTALRPATVAADRRTRYVYDGQGLVRYAVDGTGHVSSYAYDYAGNVTTTIAYAAAISTVDFTYDNVKALVAAIAVDANDRESYSVYNANGQLAYSINPGGLVTGFIYDDMGLVLRTVQYAVLRSTPSLPTLATMDAWVAAQAGNAANRVSRNWYNARGQLRFSADPEGYARRYDYNTASLLVREVTWGNPVTSTDTTTIAQFQASVHAASGSSWTDVRYTYDAAGRRNSVYDGESNRTVNTWHGNGTLKSVYDAFETSDQNRTAYFNDGAGRESAVHFAEGESEQQAVQYGYDGQGNRTTVTDANGKTTTYEYDRRGLLTKVTDAANGITTYDYNAFGEVVKTTDPVNTTKSTYTYYDILGRVNAVRDGESYVSTTTYNDFGEVASVTRYYNKTASAVSVTIPPSVTAHVKDAVTRLTYDKFGRVTQKIDAEGYVETSAYDAFGQLVTHRRYELSVYGTFGGETGAIQEAFNQAIVLRQQSDSLAAAATAADATQAAALTAKNNAQTSFNAAQTTANASAAAAATQQQTVSTLQSQISARPEHAVIANPVSFMQAYVTGLYTAASNAAAGGAQLPPEQQFGYYMNVVYPMEQAAAAAAAVLTSVQAGNPLPIGYYSPLLAANGYNSTQIASYTTLAQNLSSAQAALAPLQATANTDAAALTAAQTALTQATTNHTQAVNAATAAHTAANTADANADAAFTTAQQLSTTASSTLPGFTIADLEDAAVTTFEYDRRGNVKKSTDARGFYESYTYNAQGQRKTSVGKSATATIAAGGTTTYTYDKRGLLISETLPIQSYNSAGTALGAITNAYSYDGRGNLVSKTEAQGLPEERVTTYTYDKLNRLKTTVGEAVSGVSINVTTKAVANVSGSPTQTNTYDANGNLTKTIDAAGAVTVFFYDALNRKTVEINALGTYTAYTYDANGNVTNVKVYETTIAVPANGGASTAAPTAPSGSKRETTFEYNALGQMVKSTVVLPSDYKTGTWSGSAWTNLATTALTTEYTYDYLGNVVKVVDPNGNATFSYYDMLGRKVAQVDGQGYLTDWAYNADGNVLSERRYATRFTGTPTLGLPPYVLYDANDRVTNYTYDFNGNRLTEARTGVVVHNGSGGTNTVTSTISYLYNGLGEVTRKTEATGDQFNYTYDVGGRLTRETRPTFASNSGNVTPQSDYFYDGLGNLVRNVQAAGGDAVARVTTYSYGAGGRLASMTDAESGVRNYLYDVGGRLVLEHYARTVTATGGTTSTVYEGIGYRYDVLGRSLGQGFYAKPASTWTFQTGNDYSTLEYNAFGDVVRTGANGAWQQENKYDLAGRLWATNSGDGIWKYFGYDKSGNQTLSITGAGENMAGLTLATAFAKVAQANVNASYTVYDKRNLATSVVEEGRELTSSSSSTLTTSRAYNAFGDVATETNAGGFTITYTYNTMGRTIRTESPTVYNTLENGTSLYIKPSQDYYYDASGRLVATRDANGTYATGGTSTNGKSKATNTGNLTRLTLLAGTGYGGSEALVTHETHADTGVKETKYDIHGNARVVIDEEGRTLATQTYDKLGRMLTAARLGGLTDNYSWDILGQQVTHWNSLYTSTNKEISVFDIQGRITSSRAFGGDVTSTTYTWVAGHEAAGTGLVDTGGWTQVTTFANTMTLTEKSDLFGRAIEKTDLGGHVTAYTYDLAGRLTASAIGTTSYNYEYYNTGQVEKAYTIAPNWTYYTSTATAAASNTFSSSTTQNATYTYDALGNRLTEYGTLVNGATTVVWKNHTATYDALGRLLTDTMASTTVQPNASVAFQYDANGNIRSKTSTYRKVDASGGVGTATVSSSAWYRYDNMNRVVLNNGVLQGSAIVTSSPASVDFIGDPSQTISYNKAGQRTAVWTNKYFMFGPYSGNTPYGPISNVSLYYFGPVREDYTYNAAGQLYQVKSAESFLDFNGWLAAYNPANPLPLDAFVALPATTLRTQFTYDAMGRQTAQNGYASNGTTVIYNTTTTYNAKGQVSNTYASTLKEDSKTYTQTVTNSFGTVGTTGYALGAVTSFTSVNTVTGQTAKTASTTNTFQWWDSALQGTISYDSDTGSTSNPVYTTTFTYNGLGQMTKAQINDGLPRTVTFSLDEMGQIIRRDETNVSGQTGAPHEFWYRLGDREIGYTGNNSGEDPTMLGSLTALQDVAGNGTFRGGQTTGGSNAGFAQALESFNSHSQGSQAGGYTVQAGDTLQAIAKRLYGDSALWYKIAEVNGLSAGSSLIQGQQLTLPAGVTRNTYTDDSFRPYDPAQAIGDLSPTTPKPNKGNKCGLFGQILLAAIAIGVAILLPAVGAFTPSMLGGGILGGAASGAIGAAAGSVVSQGVGLATGIQEKFSFKGVALAALSGAVGGAFQGSGLFGQVGDKGFTAGQIGIKSGVVDAAVRGAVQSAVGQGIGVATGLQSKFSWVGVAAAGVAGGVGHIAGGGLPSLQSDASAGNIARHLGTSTASLIASAATRSAIEGTSFGRNIMAGLPDVIGQAIGSALGGALAGPGKTTAGGGGRLAIKDVGDFSIADTMSSEQLTAQLEAIAAQTSGTPVARNGRVTIGESVAGAVDVASAAPQSNTFINVATGAVEHTGTSDNQVEWTAQSAGDPAASAAGQYEGFLRKFGYDHTLQVLLANAPDPRSTSGQLFSLAERNGLESATAALASAYYTDSGLSAQDIAFDSLFGRGDFALDFSAGEQMDLMEWDLLYGRPERTTTWRDSSTYHFFDNFMWSGHNLIDDVAEFPGHFVQGTTGLPPTLGGGATTAITGTASGASRFAALFGRSAAVETEVIEQAVIHGNSKLSPRPATLYELYQVGPNGTLTFLKNGISQNPATRYSKSFMEDKIFREIATGPRSEMLTLERQRTILNPGPLNFEPWAIKAKLGQ